MVRITEELVRKRAEHNEKEIGTLEEIALHQEDIEKIEHLQHWCKDLKILLLQNNLISKIENLKKLKKLEYINLAINNIERIENLEGCESLNKLDLTLNFIGELTSVTNLKDNLFLSDLYLIGNPCADYKGYREYVITVLPQLINLDSKIILKSERINALRIFDSIKQSILIEQDEYKRNREKQKHEAIFTKKNASEESCDKDEPYDAEKEKEYWSQSTEHTPETRIEMANRIRKNKEKGERKDEKPQKRVIKLFKDDGTPYNINEAHIDFLLTEDDEENCYVLEVPIYKYLDTSFLDVDVQPTYVKVSIKGKILQITLQEEVKTEESTAKRSQFSGHLVIKMPKVKGQIKPKKIIPPPFTDNHNDKTKLMNHRRRELLEIGSGLRDMDYTKICENNLKKMNVNSNESTIRKPLRKCSIKEKIPSEDFVDDAEVPPLE